MNVNSYFDLSRFWLLMKLELFRSRKAILMTIEIALGSTFFFGMLLTIMVEQKPFFEHNSNYASTLLIGGFILSSLAFHDLGSSLKRSRYLTLPVSTLEKFVCMWLLTSVGWIVVFSVLYAGYTLIANEIGLLMFNQIKFHPFDPLGDFAFSSIKYYFILQGIFMVGGAYFKGYVFPKTLFTLILLGIICGIIGYLIIGDLMEMDTDNCLSESNELMNMPVYRLWLGIEWGFCWLFAPLCWVMTYFGLKEQEV